jgi:hypothetical protein
VGGLLSQAAAKAATQSKGCMPFIYVPPCERNAREKEIGSREDVSKPWHLEPFRDGGGLRRG